MIIGIVSKPEHCQVHARALEGEGHEVRLLGGGPLGEFPPSLEVIVIRTSSCSHGASEAAFVHCKKNQLPMVVRDGLTSIRTEIAKISKKKMPANPTWSLTPKPQTPLVLEVPAEPTIEEKVVAIFKRFSGPLGAALANEERPFFEKFKGLPGQFIGYGQQVFSKSNLPLPNLGAFENIYRAIAGEPMDERIGRIVYSAATYLHNLSGDQFNALGKALVDFDDALSNDPRTKTPFVKPGVKHPPYAGMPSHFTAAYMMVCPPGTVIRRRTFLKAYREVTQGRAIDPTGFTEIKNAFGFLVDPVAHTDAPTVSTPTETTVSAVGTDTSGVLDSVQDEILKVGVRVEEITKKFDDFSNSTNSTFYEVGKKAGEASQNITILRDDLDILRFSSQNLRKIQDEEIAKLHALVVQSSNREAEMRTQLTDLKSEMDALKARLEERPSSGGASFDEFLERLSKMGAAVNISIPARS